MAIKKDTLHPDGQPEVDIYPKTSVDQVENLNATLDYLNNSIFNKVNNTTFYEAMKSKVTRGNRQYIIYGILDDISTDYFFNVAIAPLINTIPMRNENGTLKTQTPVDSYDCVNLEYFKSNKKVYRHFVRFKCLSRDDDTEYGYYLNVYTTKDTFSIDDLKPIDGYYNVYNVVRGDLDTLDLISTCIIVNYAGEILIKNGISENLISIDVLETVEV